MRRNGILVALLAASLAGNVAFLVTAAVASQGNPESNLDKLSMTKEQLSTFEEANRAFIEERSGFMKKMSRLRQRMAAEFEKETPNRERLLDLSLEMTELQTARRPQTTDRLLSLHASLTPKQRAVLAEILKASDGGCCAACPGSGIFSTKTERGKAP